MVVAILIFVLLTPRKWFADQPQTSVAAGQGEAMIQLVAENDAAGTRTYRLNAVTLAPIRGEGGSVEYYDVGIKF